VKVAKDPANPWLVRLICAVAAIYLLCPFNLAQDTIMPIVGWIDDALILFGVITWLIEQRKLRALKSTPPVIVQP
jgi:uncharacterized membrane protein YkvA (DUF1232 family)